MNTIKPFKIRITKKVVFRDMTGTTLKTYEVNDIVTATCLVGNGGYGSYFITSMGGIYTDEAQKE